MHHFPTEPIQHPSPITRTTQIERLGAPSRYEQYGTKPSPRSRTQTHITSLHSQITAALFLGSISRIRPKIGPEGLGVQLPPLSHTPSAHKTCRRHYKHKGRPGGVDGTSHTTRYCRLILIFTILRFLPPGVHKHTEIKQGARSDISFIDRGFSFFFYLPFLPYLIFIHF